MSWGLMCAGVGGRGAECHPKGTGWTLWGGRHSKGVTVGDVMSERHQPLGQKMAPGGH